MRVLVDASIWLLALRRSGSFHNPEEEEVKRLIGHHVVEIAVNRCLSGHERGKFSATQAL